MQGEVYIPVQADASEVMLMHAAGSSDPIEGETGHGLTISWTEIGGITGLGWGNDPLHIPKPTEDLEAENVAGVNGKISAKYFWNFPALEQLKQTKSGCLKGM